MTLPGFFIIAIAIVSAISAIAVVAAKNVVRAALYLVGVLGGLGIIFILLGAEFVGWTQILSTSARSSCCCCSGSCSPPHPSDGMRSTTSNASSRSS